MRGAYARLGILGDIHAEHELLAAALAHFTREGVEEILAVGDVVDGLGSVDACCDLLREHRVALVRGNHERWLLRGEMRHLPDATAPADITERTRAYLEALPVTERICTTRGDLLLCHGLDEEDMTSVRPDDFGYALEVNGALNRLVREGEYALVVCGHSHARMVRRFGALTIINAGTLYRHHAPCFGIVDTAAGSVTFFERLAGGEIATADEVAL